MDEKLLEQIKRTTCALDKSHYLEAKSGSRSGLRITRKRKIKRIKGWTPK